MKFNFRNFSKYPKNQFERLGLWYMLALGVIAVFNILGLLYIHHQLNTQKDNSDLIRITVQQSRLSEKIAIFSLRIQNDAKQLSIDELSFSLSQIVSSWKKHHATLVFLSDAVNTPENPSKKSAPIFDKIHVPYDSILYHTEMLLNNLHAENQQSILPHYVSQILKYEQIYVEKLNVISNLYETEAKENIAKLSKMVYLLLSLLLLIIVLEAKFIFWPKAKRIKIDMYKLIESEKRANELAKEISVIYTSLEKSYEHLAKINEPVDIPRVWAKADRGGNVISISNYFQNLFGLSLSNNMRVSDLFPRSGLDDDFMDLLVDKISNFQNWYDQIMVRNEGRELWVDVTICPVLNDKKEIFEMLVVGSDITNRKRAEQDMNIKNRNEAEKRINQQKYRSVLILEGQEEERKRLAMDIHDGIGQLLTSLKFQLEAINPKDGEANIQKLKEIKDQLNDTIKEVRRITFNLKPTVLGDYGLVPGLKLFVNEISKYSDLKITFQNPDDLNDRFPERIETNVFRIVQEGINNAIKYAEATSISIIVKQIQDKLSIIIEDDGVGFDPATLDSTGIESGSGFFNMYERTEYINGKIEIESVPQEGTRVELLVPILASINL